MNKTQRTRQTLLDAAVTVLAHDPSASLAEIGEEAGVGRVTVHRYFGSREQLILELAKRALREMDEACKPAVARATSATSLLGEIIEILVGLGDRFHFLSQHEEVWRNPDIAKIQKRQDKEMSELIEEVRREGGISPTVPTAWVLAAFETLIYAAWKAGSDGSIAVNDAGRLAAGTFFTGLASS